ncbi:hypothetical protein PHYSODRAFT_489142 [Phytophthora sojae]|uniref:Uncharacterized protein n=1 Tax=Phytophthora sojae (strain P6497) TaxID=1094619 RepID=G4Z5T1_PHYSP|nr:hypothetical protein PHYSODRAFT_489142 [Phytophthora sojae]EGZ19514.1 hypothetical protein PHYSODRAFT_489142 [Phytophthora sojae]|eukprot:XP_009522231.1 hypothetical protein PHYSODRAFT_489142 [Phytophthora sojae]
MCSQRRNTRQFCKVIVLEGSVCAGYPVYQVFFTKANHTLYELLVLLVLPVLKFIIKLVSISAAIHKEEMMPEHVVFTVNVFDILYLATFMQTISSTTITVIMAIDSVHSVMSVISLHKRTQNISDRLREVLGADIPPTRFDLLEAVELLCNHPQKLYKQMHPEIRVRACVSYELSATHKCLLETIEKHLVYSSSYQKYLVLLPATSSFQPAVGAAWAKRNTTTSNADESTIGVLHEALEALFTSECLVLAEYVEFVVPLLYAVFVLTMVHLPSAQYHSEMAGVTVDNVGRAVSGILAYAMLESASFILLVAITRRHCGIRALYQLAFVLETQWSLVLSKIVLWMLFTLAFRIVHFGKFVPRRRSWFWLNRF